ncbi:MAG TPA: hypothetical protein VJR89_20735 [Polyangiales bacterium]|nr:hypothetical protein [Polyangiales bacterium]
MSSLLLLCCATHPAPAVSSQPEKLRPGDASAPPSLRALPELSKDRSERLHRGLTQAKQVFAAQLPAAPSERSYDVLSAWVESEVAHWIDARRDAVEETRFQFKSSAPEPATQVIASAVIGLLQEDTAHQLAQIPQPRELDNEPEIAALFHELVLGQADPFQRAALEEYESCAKAGDEEGGQLQRFAKFCKERHHRLAAAEAKQSQAMQAQR